VIEFDLVRTPSSVHGTFGGLYLSGNRKFYTAEPPWKNNRNRVSCIPPGRYVWVPHTSPHFGACYIATGTGRRKYILIHPGNFAGDLERGCATDTNGCILLGRWIVQMKPKGKPRPQYAVSVSRSAVREFMDLVGPHSFGMEVH